MNLYAAGKRPQKGNFSFGDFNEISVTELEAPDI